MTEITKDLHGFSSEVEHKSMCIYGIINKYAALIMFYINFFVDYLNMKS